MKAYNPNESYKQPSFFDIENTRDRLSTQLRAERFPITMAEIARDAEAVHNLYQHDSPENLSGPKRNTLGLQLMGRDRQSILDKFGRTKGVTFDFGEYMGSYMKDASAWSYTAKPTEDLVYRPTLRETVIRHSEGNGTENEGHFQSVMRGSYDRHVKRFHKLREERPALVEFSEKYIDLFGSPFVGNGHRCIEGEEGLNFLDGVEEAQGIFTKQLTPEREAQFIDSIVSIEPLGMLPVHEEEVIAKGTLGQRTEYHMEFNGWGGYAEAFLFEFSDRSPMIGYLDRSFATTPLDGESWLVLSERRAKELEKKAA